MRAILRSDKPLVRSWVFLPLVVFIAMAAIQLLPLPAPLLSVVSPATVQTRTEFLSDLPGKLNSFPISLYPHATRHDLRIVLAASAIFFAVVNYYRRPAQIKRLLAIIMAIGAGMGLLAFIQDVSGAERIYFVGPHGRGTASAGSFVHYSHFSQFMNLCVGSTISLLLLALHRIVSPKNFRLASLAERWGNPLFRPIWLLTIVIILNVTTIFLSTSRGGMITGLVGFGLVAFVVSGNKSLLGKGWLLVPVFLMVFGVISFVGMDAVFNRLSTLREAESSGGRLRMLEDLTHEWKQYPLLGTGLGTHEVVFPRYSTDTKPERATHAEDEYAQIIEEMGLVGLAIVLWFAGLIWWSLAKALRSRDVYIQLATTGLAFGLLAVTLHSLIDFGQHTPAVACLTAVTCGLIISLARLSDKSESTHVIHRPVWERSIAAALAMLMTVLGVWAVLGAGKSYAAEAQWKLADAQAEALSKNNWQGTSQQYTALLTHATAAVERDPTDAEHRYFLNVYRWHVVDNEPDGPQSRKDSERIVGDLNVARSNCPVYGPIYCLSSQIDAGVLNDSLADRHAQAAYELSQTDSTACLIAARADIKAGRWNDSKSKLQRFLALHGAFEDVINAYLRDSSHPELAMELAQDDPAHLQPLAAALRADPGYSGQAEQIDARSFELLKQKCSRTDASAELLVSFAEQSAKRNDLQGAVESYRRAIGLDYGDVDRHLALARLLAQSKQAAEAKRETRICLQLRPQMAAARQLLHDLEPSSMGQNQ